MTNRPEKPCNLNDLTPHSQHREGMMGSSSALQPTDEIVMREIEQAAETGARFPTGDDLLDKIGFRSVNATVKAIQRLEAAGLIQVDRYQRERRATIVATGKQTAEVKTPVPHWRSVPRPLSMPGISPLTIQLRNRDFSRLIMQAARDERLSPQDFIFELVWLGWQVRDAQKAAIQPTAKTGQEV